MPFARMPQQGPLRFSHTSAKIIKGFGLTNSHDIYYFCARLGKTGYMLNRIFMRSRKRPSPFKQQLLRLAAPIFVETLLIMMLGAVDTVMLSRHSDNSVVNQIIMLTFLVFEVINLGTSVLCSQYIGARLDKKVTQVVGISLMVNLVVGLAVSTLLYFGCHTILRWMGLGPELLADGVDYMRIVGAFAFFQAISMTLSAALRSAGLMVTGK